MTRSSRKASAPDRIFEALDGRRLRVKGHDWRVEVYGVFQDAGRRWVQLALEGEQHQVLTLRLAPTHGPRQAIRSLSSWLTDPDTSSEVLQHVA